MDRGGLLSPLRDMLAAAPDARSRRISVFVGGFLLMVGTVQIARFTFRNFGPVPLFYVLLCVAAGGASLCVWSALRQRAIPLAQSAAAEVLLLLPLFWIIPINQRMLIEAGLLKTPFWGLKLVTVVLAMVVPGPYVLQVVLYVAFAAEALILWFALDMAAVPGLVASGEPGYTLIFFFAIGVLIAFRWRHEMLERDLHQTRARARVLTAVAHMFLRVREQSNTPLQNLRLLQKLMENGRASQAEMQEAMGRSLARLEDLNKGLDRYDHLIDWSGDPLAFDADAEALLASDAESVKPPEPEVS